MDFFSSLITPPKEESRSQKTEVFSGLSSLLKNTMSNKFFTFFDEIVKPALQRNEQEIASNYKKINQFIDEIHEHVQKLLKQHQQDVFEIVREEMKQAYAQVKKLTTQLNKKILLKNENEEVWFLSNQLDYFKAEALKLFSTNNQLRVQNKMMAKTIKDYQLQLESLDHTLQKIKKKSMRDKSLRRAERPEDAERRNSVIKIRTKESLQANKRLVTELSSIMKTEVEKEGKQFDDSRININIPLSNSNLLLSNPTAKPFQNSHILITLEDEEKSGENMSIPNFSGNSQKSKKSRISRHFDASQLFLRQRQILQCLDKSTQTDFIPQEGNKQELVSEMAQTPHQNHTRYQLNLSKNGFKFNATNLKTRRIDQLALRSSVDYEGNRGMQMRSMNNSFLRNRLQDSFATNHKKKGSLFKPSGYLPAK